MELVPILSTIILVGTIATFILAVAAYILYKIRERRVHDEGSAYMTVEQEPHHVLVSPQPVESAAAPAPTPRQAPAAIPAGQTPSTSGSMFWEYTDQGFVPVRPQASSDSGTSEETEHAPNGGSAWL